MRILFVLIHAEIGGIEKAFTNLLVELSRNTDFEIDVFLMCHRGVFLDKIKELAYVYPENKTLRLIGISQKEAFCEGCLYGIKRLCLGFTSKYISKSIAYRIASRKVNVKEYDIAISFMHNMTKSFYGGANEFVLQRVNAHYKATFIHADLLRAKLNTKYNHKLYKKFDKIASVSESCKRLFDAEWPDLSHKSFTVHNVYNIDEINEKSNIPIEDLFSKDTTNFVTVARMDKVKGIERTLRILSEIKNEVNPFKWIIVGGGSLLSYYRETAERLGIEKVCIFVGEKDNPYPYIRRADFLLSCSYQEAAPMVYGEAQCLGVPILSTKTLSAIELVEKKRIGIVCENTEYQLKEALLSFLRSKQKIMCLKDNYPIKIDNKEELKEFYANILNCNYKS